MPEFDTSKIERTHKAKGNKYEIILQIIAKFLDWTFSEQVKSSFIKAAKDKKE